MNELFLSALQPLLHTPASAGASALRPSGAGPGKGTPPEPPPGPPSPPDEEHETGIDVRERPKTHVPRRYRVLFHNDDYTTMEFVVDALVRFFHRSQAEATHIMLTVHKKGSGVAGIYTRDIAETKVEEVMKHARESGMPLLVTAEPE
ncbi:MAG TPA: ATP-dependent Clp protease adaptor ClpS [Polyangiaceae bacterium]|jgi:ATP-dependent Clp protease adaptor protein ClpS